MINHLKIKAVSFVVALLLSASVFAAPNVSINVVAEKDVVEVNKKGKKKTKRVIATETVPGDILFYTISFENSGDEPAENVQVDNPVSESTVYQAKSAWGENSDILFSVDGKVFKKASSLTYEVTNKKGKVEKKRASPEQYKAIRWVVAEIPVKSKGQVGFSVVVQ